MILLGFLLLSFTGLYAVAPRLDFAGRRIVSRQQPRKRRSVAKRTVGRDVASLSSEMQVEFSAWLDCYGGDVNPWLKFELHIAEALSRTCGAGDVRCYRVLGDESLMLPLRDNVPQSTTNPRTPSARVAAEVVRHVQPFHSSIQSSDEQIARNVSDVDACVSWAFPVISGWSVIGVVTVRELSGTAWSDVALLQRLADAISEQWRCVAEMWCAGQCGVDEASTELMTRTKFMRRAAQLVLRSRRISGALTDLEMDSPTMPNTRIEPAEIVTSDAI